MAGEGHRDRFRGEAAATHHAAELRASAQRRGSPRESRCRAAGRRPFSGADSYIFPMAILNLTFLATMKGECLFGGGDVRGNLGSPVFGWLFKGCLGEAKGKTKGKRANYQWFKGKPRGKKLHLKRKTRGRKATNGLKGSLGKPDFGTDLGVLEEMGPRVCE